MKKTKTIIISIILALVGIVLVILGTLWYSFISKYFVNNKNSSNEKDYKINIEKVAIATLNDDDIFYKNLKDNYKGFKLIFVSAEIKNNSQKNFENLKYKLITSNNNEYNKVSSYVTENEEFIENYYKINNKIFDDSTNDLLGSKNKRIIVGFMIPENELINDTQFQLTIDSFDIENGDVKNLEFSSNEITKSYSMKELYKEDEIEKAEQTISLAYLVSVNDWQQWMINWEKAYNYKYDDLFTIAFSTIKVFAESSNDYIGWNGRKINNEKGSKLNFDKAKALYPDISEQIEGTKNTINDIIDLHSTYNGTINSLDTNKLQQIDTNVVKYIWKLNEFFELEKSRY